MTYKLEDIGFYTLSDKRAKTSSEKTDLQRCEIILTDKCNFKCPYCRGVREDIKGTLNPEYVIYILEKWIKEGIKNIRFSGGEPSLYDKSWFLSFVDHCKINGVERIAISTNGSAKLDYYKQMIDFGVNDFSISLDGCCSAAGEKMNGGIKVWDKIIDNIRELSKLTYTTVGIVFNEDNVEDCYNTIIFADSLGVSDIRVIPSAQYNQALDRLQNLPDTILDRHLILKYRITNIKNGRHVRGIENEDNYKCPLVLDDMAVAGEYHFPCIIYMREQGDPIGKMKDNVRQDRFEWYNNHNCYQDKICKENCLDVCRDYNNKWRDYHNFS